MSFVRPNKFVFTQWAKDVVNSDNFIEDVKKFAKDREMDVNTLRYFAKHFLKKSEDQEDIESLTKLISMLEESENISEYKSFKEFRKESLFESLIVAETDEEKTAALADIFSQELDTQELKDIDEGWLGSLASGALGFIAGPTIGKVIANALGVEKGVLYDMFTSRLVGAALGMAINKHIGGK